MHRISHCRLLARHVGRLKKVLQGKRIEICEKCKNPKMNWCRKKKQNLSTIPSDSARKVCSFLSIGFHLLSCLSFSLLSCKHAGKNSASSSDTGSDNGSVKSNSDDGFQFKRRVSRLFTLIFMNTISLDSFFI